MKAQLQRLFQSPAFWGYVFISPWLLGFLIFQLGPMLASLAFSFTRYDLAEMEFVGLAQYERALTNDPLFWKSLWNTTLYTLITVPLGLTGSLILAVLLDQKIRGLPAFRALYYIPSLVPTIAAAMIWLYVFHHQFGILNAALRWVGLVGPDWFNDARFALPAFMLMSLWGIGGARMVIFLAGLQNIPPSLYEAASIDGASPWQKFRHVTLPLLSPVIFFNMVLGIIGSFQVFNTAFIINGGGGGPLNATLFYVLYLFQISFAEFRVGYGSALAWILFLLLLGVTLLQFRQAKSWVHYEGESR